MSDSVVKLRIDSKEYDANIKRAGQALTDYFNKVKEGGGTLKYLDEGVLEAVQAMGKLGTQASSVKGGLRELTQATSDMTVAYRALTDEEKASPIGAAMAESIQQMTERAGEMRDAMADVQASINNAASDTRVFDQISGGTQLMTAGFQSAVGAMKLFGVETDNNVEVLAQLQAAMGVVNGLQTIQTALQKQSAVMQGVQAVQAAAAAAAQTSLAGATGAATVAQKAFNLVAKANPYVLLATAVAAVGTALYAFASASSKAKQEAKGMAKAEEEAAKKSEDVRNAFVNASAEAMNSASRLSSLQVAYKNANSEIEKTDILKQAQQEFKKLGFECNGLNDAQTLLIKNGAKVIELIQLQGNAAAVSAVRMEKFKESFKMLMENGYSANTAATLAGYNKDVQELDGQLTTMQSRIQNLKGGLGIGGKGGSRSGGGSAKEQTEEQMNSAQIEKLTQEYITATNDRRTAIEKEIEVLQKRNAEIQKLKDMAQGKQFDAGSIGEVTVTGNRSRQFSKLNEGNISGMMSDIKQQIQTADIGSELYNSLTAKLADTNTFKTVIETMVKNGIDVNDIDASSLWKKIVSGENIENADWQGMVDKINAKLKELGIEPIKIDFKTGGLEEAGKDAKSATKDFQQAASAIGSVGSALSSIEDPSAKVAGIVAQAIATVASAFAGALHTDGTTKSNIWAFIGAAAASTATMISTIASIHSATGYAQGGVIKGNSYSGDNIVGMVDGGAGGFVGLNAQEIVLNQAQTANVANALEGSGMRGIDLSASVSGEQILLVANRTTRRQGRGELVTWK